MYAITLRGKPVTIAALYAFEDKPDWNLAENERTSFLAAKTKAQAINLYLHYIGFTWVQRHASIDVARMTVAEGK